MLTLNVKTKYCTNKEFKRRDNLETTKKLLSRYIARELGDDRGYKHIYKEPIEVESVGDDFFSLAYTIQIEEDLGEFFECPLANSADELADKLSFIDYGDKTSLYVEKCRIKYV